MEINLTFCVQVINFLVFYWASSRFLLKPFVAFIQSKVASRQQVLADFAEKELQLKKLVHERVDFAQQFKQKLKTQYELPVIIEVDQIQRPAIPQASAQELGVMTKRLVAHLVTGIKDAY